MKKRLITAICILTAATASSCVEPESITLEDNLQSIEFKATNEGAETKTTLTSDFRIKWSTKDHITVFSGVGKGTTFSDVTVSSDGRTATFAGSASWSPEYFALYPAQTDAVLSENGTITATLPTTQKAINNNIADKMNLAVAVSDEDNLLFRNVGALMCITLPTSYGSYLKIESLNPDVKMSGKAEIRMVEGIPTAVPAADAVNYVEFNGLSGLKANNTLYFVVYPGNYDKGFRLTVHNSQNTCKYVMSTSKPLNLERNDNVKLFPSVTFKWNTAWEPYSISPVQTSSTSVALSWMCNSANDQTAGYNVYLRDGEDTGEGTLVKTISGKTNMNCELTGLETGKTYDFGVQTEGGSYKDSGIVWYEDFTMKADVKYGAEVTISTLTEEYAYIAVDYEITNLKESNPEKGLWISSTGSEVGVSGSDGFKIKGPGFLSGGAVKQLVPASRLDASKKYHIRAYVWDAAQNKYEYSEPQEIQLASQPEAISLNWNKQEYADLPDAVSVYKTTSQLNGRNFNAWYAVADPKEVDFRVQYPETVGSKKTVKAQAEAAGDCYVLINGAIYGNYNIGVIMTEGRMTQQWHGEIEGQYWATNDQLYQITRAIIGVDSEGNPDAYWVGVPSQNTFYYYDSPLTSVVGQAKYDKVTNKTPYPAVSWNPYYAISCGPMLVYDGKIMVNQKMAGNYFMTNYECWSESGVYDGTPDRTAVGVTEDGKIILFVCDGRIDASKGASITELAKIMKGLGCKYAMNLDGGGSTGMWVNGSGMINYKDNSWREVKSTCGFFEKNSSI